MEPRIERSGRRHLFGSSEEGNADLKSAVLLQSEFFADVLDDPARAHLAAHHPAMIFKS
jgi:hypothetical protein